MGCFLPRDPDKGTAPPGGAEPGWIRLGADVKHTAGERISVQIKTNIQLQNVKVSPYLTSIFICYFLRGSTLTN